MRIIVANIQSGIGITKGYRQYVTSGWRYVLPYGGREIASAGKFLADEHADLAFLMEIDDGSRRSRNVSQVATIGEASGLEHARFFPTPRNKLVNEGSAILSRHPVISSRSHLLPSSVNHRVLGETVVDINGTHVTAFVAHLALGSKPRREQLAFIANIVKEIEGPVLLGGDFNERDTSALSLLEEAGLARISALGYPSWNPRHELQALFLSKHFTIAGASVPKVAFSDHLPLVVDIDRSLQTEDYAASASAP